MDSSELCSKCLKLKERSDFSKAQFKKKGPKICLQCSININPPTIPQQKDNTISIPRRLFKPLYGIEGDKADQMTCLTMHQPWASLLVCGIKRAEGRGWNTDFRGRLWIHAGCIDSYILEIAAKEPSPEIIAACENKYREIYNQHDCSVEFPKHYPTSALIGCVDIVDVLSASEARAVPLPDTVMQHHRSE